MTPATFPEANVVWAKDQPEYRPLPAWRNPEESISYWRLSWRERLALVLGGGLWVRQANFGQPLQPLLLTLERPFNDPPARGYTPDGQPVPWPAPEAGAPMATKKEAP